MALAVLLCRIVKLSRDANDHSFSVDTKRITAPIRWLTRRQPRDPEQQGIDRLPSRCPDGPGPLDSRESRSEVCRPSEAHDRQMLPLVQLGTLGSCAFTDRATVTSRNWRECRIGLCIGEVDPTGLRLEEAKYGRGRRAIGGCWIGSADGRG